MSFDTRSLGLFVTPVPVMRRRAGDQRASDVTGGVHDRHGVKRRRLVVKPGSLLQFNQSARTLTSSLRLKWEYNRGSEMFLAYSDGRNTLGTGFPDVLNQSFIVKVTRLVRFWGCDDRAALSLAIQKARPLRAR